MNISDEIKRICANEYFGYDDALLLASEEWLNWSSALSDDDRKEAIMIYQFARGYIHEVNEGYADGSKNDDYLLHRLQCLAKRLA